MLSSLTSMVPFIRATTKAGTHGTAALSLRSAIVPIGGYSLVVVGLWGIFGIFNGFNGETGLIYPSDIASGLDGFFYGDPLRKFESVFYHLAYVLGAAVGERGSFVPYQLVYGALWVGRSVLTYLIVQRIMPDRPALAILAGLFAALHAADGSLNWIGQLNQFGFIFLMLLSFFLLLVAMDSRRTITAILWAASSALAGYMSLWSYESPLPVMLVFPSAAALLRRDVPLSRLFYASGIYLIPVAAFIGENVQRYLASGGDGDLTYQASVSRQSFSPGALISDLWFHLENSLAFWQWPGVHFEPNRLWDYVLALLPVLVAILVLVPTAIRSENRNTRPFRLDLRLLVFASLSFGLLVASYLVILLLNDNRLLWRTEFLPGFATACLGGTALYALLNRVQTTARRTVLAVGVITLVGVFSVLAGVNSGMLFHEMWERQRAVMSSIIANAPSVADGTLFVIRNIDRQKEPFGHNMWFDLALRLAYPDTTVAGIYFLADKSAAPGADIDIENGEPHLLPDGGTLFHSVPDPRISHVIVFDYDPTSEQAEPVLSGPVKVGNDEIPAARYDFCAAVVGFEPNPVAMHRYGPITANHPTTCPKRDALRSAGRDPNPARTAALAGTVGIGVLNRKGNEVLVSRPAAASDNVQTVFLRTDSFAASGDLALRNWDKRSSSEGILQEFRTSRSLSRTRTLISAITGWTALEITRELGFKFTDITSEKFAVSACAGYVVSYLLAVALGDSSPPASSSSTTTRPVIPRLPTRSPSAGTFASTPPDRRRSRQRVDRPYIG